MLHMGLLPLALLLELGLVLLEAVLEHSHKIAGNSCDPLDHYGKSCSGHHLHSLIAIKVS